jgi:alpha-tubulin suppressor-like RCC1 family protein
MARQSVLDLPLDLFTAVCLQLDLHDLVRVAATCRRLRHGDTGLETAELPTKSPVVAALRAHAFRGGLLVPSTRPIGCSESRVAYLTRCVRQRRCREVAVVGTGSRHTLLVDASGRLLACGWGLATGHADAWGMTFLPSPVVAMAEVRVRSLAAGLSHSLALSRDGRVYSWGENRHGQLGHGDKRDRPLPALLEGLEGVRAIASAVDHSLAVMQSGLVFSWGETPQGEAQDTQDALRPRIVEGFGVVRICCVSAGMRVAFAIGESGEFFSWGSGGYSHLGHGDTRDQPSPRRVEALRGVRVRSVSVGLFHALALAEDGLVYAWGNNMFGALLGKPSAEDSCCRSRSRRSGACAWVTLPPLAGAATQ